MTWSMGRRRVALWRGSAGRPAVHDGPAFPVTTMCSMNESRQVGMVQVVHILREKDRIARRGQIQVNSKPSSMTRTQGNPVH